MPTRDASSPAAVISATNGASVATASFTPPAGSRIAVEPFDASTGGLKTFTPSNTGFGGTLSWVKIAANATEANDIWLSSVVVGGAAGTVTVARTAPNAGQFGFSTDVWTGVQAGAIVVGTSVVGAVNNGGTSTTNNLSVNAITTTVDGSRVIGGSLDDSASGAMTSTDSNVPVTMGTTGDGVHCWKAADTPTAGTVVQLNFDAGGAAAVAHRWCAAELLPVPPVAIEPGALLAPVAAVQRSYGW